MDVRIPLTRKLRDWPKDYQTWLLEEAGVNPLLIEAFNDEPFELEIDVWFDPGRGGERRATYPGESEACEIFDAKIYEGEGDVELTEAEDKAICDWLEASRGGTDKAVPWTGIVEQ
jgi:hypothetical protein